MFDIVAKFLRVRKLMRFNILIRQKILFLKETYFSTRDTNLQFRFGSANFMPKSRACHRRTRFCYAHVGSTYFLFCRTFCDSLSRKGIATRAWQKCRKVYCVRNGRSQKSTALAAGSMKKQRSWAKDRFWKAPVLSLTTFNAIKSWNRIRAYMLRAENGFLWLT